LNLQFQKNRPFASGIVHGFNFMKSDIFKLLNPRSPANTIVPDEVTTTEVRESLSGL
jgi:hypothetical protein